MSKHLEQHLHTAGTEQRFVMGGDSLVFPQSYVSIAPAEGFTRLESRVLL